MLKNDKEDIMNTETNFNSYGHGAKVPVDLDKDIKKLERYLGVDTKASRIPTYFAFGGLGLIFFGMLFQIFIVIGIILELIGLFFAIKKEYSIAYKWNRSIVMYLKNGFKESNDYLERLPNEEKEKESYKKMKKLLLEKEEFM
ncbi:hypothetical protein CLTHE_16860 [Clostridium thermobutyricum DSM 4928]|uniref:Uncharacterized protein n=2 Tax=Clostridium thermobutyricum TaxID=29372 RepID=A0A1V4SW20_9CLOT|nr:hypothetical protein CLTHE_16860 [Clostridium thermobutyricum DSM 4928]